MDPILTLGIRLFSFTVRTALTLKFLGLITEDVKRSAENVKNYGTGVNFDLKNSPEQWREMGADLKELMMLYALHKKSPSKFAQILQFGSISIIDSNTNNINDEFLNFINGLEKSKRQNDKDKKNKDYKARTNAYLSGYSLGKIKALIRSFEVLKDIHNHSLKIKKSTLFNARSGSKIGVNKDKINIIQDENTSVSAEAKTFFDHAIGVVFDNNTLNPKGHYKDNIDENDPNVADIRKPIDSFLNPISLSKIANFQDENSGDSETKKGIAKIADGSASYLKTLFYATMSFFSLRTVRYGVSLVIPCIALAALVPQGTIPILTIIGLIGTVAYLTQMLVFEARKSYQQETMMLTLNKAKGIFDPSNNVEIDIDQFRATYQGSHYSSFRRIKNFVADILLCGILEDLPQGGNHGIGYKNGVFYHKLFDSSYSEQLKDLGGDNGGLRDRLREALVKEGSVFTVVQDFISIFGGWIFTGIVGLAYGYTTGRNMRMLSEREMGDRDLATAKAYIYSADKELLSKPYKEGHHSVGYHFARAAFDVLINKGFVKPLIDLAGAISNKKFTVNITDKVFSSYATLQKEYKEHIKDIKKAHFNTIQAQQGKSVSSEKTTETSAGHFISNQISANADKESRVSFAPSAKENDGGQGGQFFLNKNAQLSKSFRSDIARAPSTLENMVNPKQTSLHTLVSRPQVSNMLAQLNPELAVAASCAVAA